MADDINAVLNGGPSYYDPAMGMMLVQNPEAAAALLASRGAPVPPDAKPGITYQDAHQGLGAALSGQVRNPTTMGEGWERMKGMIASPFQKYYGAMEQSLGPQAQKGDRLPGPMSPSQEPSPMVRIASGSGGAGILTPEPSAPTPSPESVNSGGAVPGPATAEKPGDFSRPDPTPAGMQMTQGPDTPVHPDKTVDGLSKALAGLHAMKPDVLRPSTPAPYRATNPIARSNLPQALMAEILGAAKPTSQFRLGEALKGRSFA